VCGDAAKFGGNTVAVVRFEKIEFVCHWLPQ
jgi:hypothetical protein